MKLIFTLIFLFLIFNCYSQSPNKRKTVKKSLSQTGKHTISDSSAIFGTRIAKDTLPRQTITEKRLNGPEKNAGVTARSSTNTTTNKNFVDGIQAADKAAETFDTTIAANALSNNRALVTGANNINNGNFNGQNNVTGSSANGADNANRSAAGRNNTREINTTGGNMNTGTGNSISNNSGVTANANTINNRVVVNNNVNGNNTAVNNNSRAVGNISETTGNSNNALINLNDSTLNVNTVDRNTKTTLNVDRRIATGNVAKGTAAIAGDTIYNVNTLTQGTIPTNSGATDKSGQVQFGQTNWGNSRSTVGESQWTVPPPITTTFNKEFPGHTTATWSRSNWALSAKDSAVYTAKYKAGASWVTANYNALGERIDVRTEIPYAKAPEAIKSLVDRQFKGLDITSFIRIQVEGRPDVYEVRTRSGRTISITNNGNR